MDEGFLLGRVMCKESRCLKLAAKAAEQSGHDIFRHGAVLVRGGSILNIAANSDNHTAFGQRFRVEPGRATHHAETACVLGLDKAMTQGGVIYAARVNKDGEWKMSKPCSMCHEVMKFVGIKKVVYTVGPDDWDSYKFTEEVEIGYED
jgi:tRNA(Arg) A34 adenosine deaminase TadA